MQAAGKKLLTTGPADRGWKPSRNVQCRLDQELQHFEKHGNARNIVCSIDSKAYWQGKKCAF